MIQAYGAGLASDSILHRYGFDGHESKDVLHLCKRYSELGVRSTFAINTYYQEVKGGYYENRALYELIDNALRGVELMPVLQDYFSDIPEQLVPVEGVGRLLVDEAYALISANQVQVGFLQIWRFHAGGGGEYYSDRVIFDLTLPPLNTSLVVTEVEKRCQAKSVEFVHWTGTAKGVTTH